MIDMEIIKKMSLRLPDGSFSDPYPFGAEGKNVEMLSGVNLEEEFHLGSPNVTSFSTDENGMTIIREEYKKTGQSDNYYVMVTTFENNDSGGTIISQKLYFSSGEQLTLKKTKITTFIGSGDDFQIKEEVV